MTGRIHAIESLSSRDGPGLRQVVFLQGCPLRCRYCHNPNAWPIDAGEAVETERLMQRLIRLKPYLGNNSGVTFSGGEPLLQPGFLLELLFESKKIGFHTAIDTSGWQLHHVFNNSAQTNASEHHLDESSTSINCLLTALLAQTDLLLIDIKAVESTKYQLLTGQNCSGRDFLLKAAVRLRKPVWLRHVLVPDWNNSPDDLRNLAEWVCQQVDQGLPVEQLTLLPYHRLAEQKYEQLGLQNAWPDVAALPVQELNRCVEEVRSMVADRFNGDRQPSFSIESGL